MARIIISSGHTQNDPGAIAGDLREVDLTRKIAGLITNKLRNKGIITLSVPPELDLLQRIDWINKTGYSEETDDLCIEIHVNDGGKTGLEGWYKEKGENKSKQLVDKILDSACQNTNLENQGTHSEYDHPLKTLAFLHNTKPTSALIECLYIDNPVDQEFLRDEKKLELLAQGIVNGLLEFLGISDLKDKNVPDNQVPKPQSTAPPVTTPTTPYSPTPTQTAPSAFPAPYPPISGYGTGNVYGKTQPLSVDDKKKVIQDKYQQILGRKVNDQDLNYFTNLGLTEEQMIKRLVESQEHADLVKDSQEYKKIKPEYDQLKIDTEKLKSQKADQEELIKKQNELIDQKNRSIQELQKSIDSVSFPTSSFDQKKTLMANENVNNTENRPEPQQREKVVDKVLRKLNDIFD